jgi:hypothetical protein
MNMSSNNEAHLEHPEATYERTDLSATGVLGFLVGLAITLALIHLVLWGMYRYLDHYQTRSQPRLSPLQNVHPDQPDSRTVQQFPLPRLQPDPVADLNKFRAQQDAILSSYGPSSAQAGAVRIPIERAIDMLAQRGLPTRPEAGGVGQGNPALGPAATRSRAAGAQKPGAQKQTNQAAPQ